MGNKRFWLDLSHRDGLKRTDKLLIGNVDNEAPEYIDLSEILAALTTEDLSEGANAKYMTLGERNKLANLPSTALSSAQIAQGYYPLNSNPADYLTASSSLSSSKLSGIIANALIPDLDASKVVSGNFAAARIGDLPASKVTSGTFAVDRIPDLPTSKITGLSGQFSNYILNTQKGAALGVAPLDADAVVGVGYIPGLDAAKIISGTFADARIPSSVLRRGEIDQPNGVAGTDANGKVNLNALPDSILGQVKYVSTWDASTNTPELPAANGVWALGEKYEGLPVDSCFFIVDVAGEYEGTDYNAGDWIISDGAVWKKVDNSDAVTTVFGRLGNIVANEADYEAFYPKLSSAYADPSWITSLAFSKITGVPDFALTSALSAYEPAFTKNTAFNKNFGTTAGTVLEGNWRPDLSGYLSLSGGILTGNIQFNSRLRALGGVSQSEAGINRIDLGVQDSTPRMVFEKTGGTTPVWLIDNSGANFRWFTPGVQEMTLSSTTLNVFSKNILAGSFEISNGTITNNLLVSSSNGQTASEKLDVRGNIKGFALKVSSTIQDIDGVANAQGHNEIIGLTTGNTSASSFNHIISGATYLNVAESANRSFQIAVDNSSEMFIRALHTTVNNQFYKVWTEKNFDKYNIPQSSIAGLTFSLNAKVNVEGAQTINGTKTFSAAPVVPTPTLDDHAATKAYVDANAGASELEKITEGGKTGWRLLGVNPFNYGEIGIEAKDFSSQSAASSVNGATGTYAFAAGVNTRASGYASFALGFSTIASGSQSTALGYQSQATGTSSFAVGQGALASAIDSIALGASTNATGTNSVSIGKSLTNSGFYATALGYANTVTSNSGLAANTGNTASGRAAAALGYSNYARAEGELALGVFGTDYAATSPNGYSATDRVFNVGSGTSSTRADAFTIFKSGAAKFHPISGSNVTNASVGMIRCNSENGNKLEFYDGTQWKEFAFV